MNSNYFKKDRKCQIKDKVNQALDLLDQVPIEKIKFKNRKALVMYKRGKVLDFMPDYMKGAEDSLLESIKLVSDKNEVWNTLGHVYLKKGDILESKKCLEKSIELESKKNKQAFRNLSMVYRKLTESEEDGKKLT